MTERAAFRSVRKYENFFDIKKISAQNCGREGLQGHWLKAE